MNLALIAYVMTHYNGGTRYDLINIHAFQCSQRSSSLFVHQVLPLSDFFLHVEELSHLGEEG